MLTDVDYSPSLFNALSAAYQYATIGLKAEVELLHQQPESVGLIVLSSVPPGRLVGEWSAEAPVPGLVPLRALPSAAR